jgi:uncharacterized protein (TIGR02600 family)
MAPAPTSRWYSNYPPKPAPNRYGTNVSLPLTDFKNPNRHPGYDPANWNCTLDVDSPLLPDTRRIQAILPMEFFCAAEGWTLLNPEWTVVLDGTFVNAITVNGQNVFKTDETIVLKSNTNVFTPSGVHRSGGSANPAAVYSGRQCPATGSMPPDPNFDNTAGDQPHTKLANMKLTSSFFTVPSGPGAKLKVDMPGRDFVIKIYDSHDWQNRDPIQEIVINYQKINGASVTVPIPQLEIGWKHKTQTVVNGVLTTVRCVDPPSYWAFQFGGALGRYVRNGIITPANIKDHTYAKVIPQGSNPSIRTMGRLKMASEGFLGSTMISGRDTVRTIIPALGDYRILAALHKPPAEIWQLHPKWNDETVSLAHNFSPHDTGDSGFDVGATGSQFMSQVTAAYGSKNPDSPKSPAALNAINYYLDFDNGQGDTRDGAYTNKPDEGNFSTLEWVFSPGGVKSFRNGYFYASYEMETDKTVTNNYFTPNRLVASPVMFGSLVPCVFDPSKYVKTAVPLGFPNSGAGRPWQTLLFRPHVKYPAVALSPTPGQTGDHPGQQNPPDHHLLDLFNMPVVEPYAISEPLSQAGKVNLNYQIVPFTYINRATALHGVLKGILMRGVPNEDAVRYKSPAAQTAGVQFPPVSFWDESKAANPANNNKYWHRLVDPAETLKQLSERFNFSDAALPDRRKGLLRSASQVCELHMIPKNITGAQTVPSMTGSAARNAQMGLYWQNLSLTGDNTREEPYNNIYPKLTTRSNTFRVHVRTQVIKKARSGDPTMIDKAKDKAISEYRGSYLIERYIDPTDTAAASQLKDYAAGGDPFSQPTLDSYYRFRVLETKRFSP